MSGAGLPVNVDVTYDGSPTDPSFDLHQQHHDLIHKLVNLFDKDASPTAGFMWFGDGTLFGSRQQLSTDNPGVVKKTVSSTTYTLLGTDQGRLLHFTSATGCTVTVPTGLVTIADAVFLWRQYATAQVTFIDGGAGNANVRGFGGALKSAGQYAQGDLIRVGSTEEYILGGQTTV